MRGIAFLILLSLAGCATPNAVGPASSSSEVAGWQEASGKSPSRAEFAAVVAACQDRAGSGPLDGCLADLGLRRVQ